MHAKLASNLDRMIDIDRYECMIEHQNDQLLIMHLLSFIAQLHKKNPTTQHQIDE